MVVERPEKPSVLMVGGPDVDARINLMHGLKPDFNCVAAGTDHRMSGRFAQAGFEYINYPMVRQFNPFKDVVALVELARIMRRISPEIVHTFDTKPNVYGRIAAHLAKVPIVIGSVTGLGSLYTYHSRSTYVLRTINEALQRITCSLSDVTIFHNRQDYQYFLAKKLAPVDKSTVIFGSGVRSDQYDPTRYSPEERTAIKQEIFKSSDVTVVTTIARMIRSKGAVEFGEASRLVQVRYPKIRFLFVGASDEQSVDNLNDEEVNRLKERVTLAGYQWDIPRILAATDIFVLPSYREGLSRVLLEAALMALPLITSDVPGCRDIVTDRVTGRLIPVQDSRALAEAVIDLVKHPELRYQYGRAARESVARQYDLSLVVTRVREIYLSLLNNHLASGGEAGL